MPPASIMDQVNNIKPLYDDKHGLYRTWIRQGEKWDEKIAYKEARALAAHFAEAIETMPWPKARRPHYTPSDVNEAATEMIEEFKNDELPMWSDVPPSPGMGAAEGWVVTHDGETLKTGFMSDFEAVNWLHNRQSASVHRAVKYEGYDIVLIRNGKVVYSYKAEQNKGRAGK